MRTTVRYRLFALAAVALLAASVSACGTKKDVIPPGATDPDKFLFDRGNEALEKRRWMTAREYLRRIIDGYPQSLLRPDAKLGIGDSYLGENTPESLLLSANEFREFLTFYPTNPRADYAQYKLGMTYFKAMRGPQRDQTETREAVKEFRLFMDRYPNSALKPEVEGKLREALDRVGQAEYQVGVFYYKQRWYPGAIERLKALMKADPGFSYRDGLYYYLAESLIKIRLDAEALPLLERLVAEFETSDFLEKGKLRLAELKANMANAGAPVTPPATPPADSAASKPAADQKPQ